METKISLGLHFYDGTITFLYEYELEDNIKNKNFREGYGNVTVLKPIRKHYDELYLIYNPNHEYFEGYNFIGRFSDGNFSGGIDDLDIDDVDPMNCFSELGLR